MNDDDLRNALHDALPTDPDTSGWTEQVRRRARRTRSMAGAGAGLALVAVLAVFGVVFWPSLSPGLIAEPAHAPQATTENIPTSSPSGQVGPTTPKSPEQACQGLTPSQAPATVPDDATRLRLCPTKGYAAFTSTPLDALRGARAAVVLKTVKQQPRLDRQAACTDEYGPDYLLVAEFDNRPSVVMVLQLYGCKAVGITGDERTGAPAVLDAFTAQLKEQRAADPETETELRTGKLCSSGLDTPTSVIPVDLTRVLEGRLCAYSRPHASVRESSLTTADTREIATAIRTQSEPMVGIPCPYSDDVLQIALVDSHGDVLVLTKSCVGRYLYENDGKNLQWTPPQQLARRLDQLAKG